MKKIISVLAVLCLLILVFCACDVLGDSSFGALNDKLSEYYSGWTLTVTTIKNDVSLTNEFDISRVGEGYEIDYTLEKLNELSIDASSEFKSTLDGKALVRDGKVILAEGNSTDVDLSGMTEIGMKFDGAYFSDVSFTTSMFKAEVTSPKDFLGKDVECSDMTVTASFGEKTFKYITISYTSSDGAKVTYRYDFEA